LWGELCCWAAGWLVGGVDLEFLFLEGRLIVPGSDRDDLELPRSG
jgi:hypothetical protein